VRQVVSIEPEYAQAWVELAHAKFGQIMLGISASDVMPVGLDAAYRAVSADPHLAEAHGLLGLLRGIYEHDWLAAQTEFRLALELNAAAVAVAYCRAGMRIKAEQVLSEIEQKRRDQYIPFAVIAFTAAAVGYVNRAFDYFDSAMDNRDGIMSFVATERTLDSIRSESRYAKLLRRMNLETHAAGRACAAKASRFTTVYIQTDGAPPSRSTTARLPRGI
jgi:hypothetical protein